VYQDLSTHHDWPVKSTIVDLSIRLKGNLKSISGNSLHLLWAQNKDITAASQKILIRVRFRLWCRLGWGKNFFWNIKILLRNQSNKIWLHLLFLTVLLVNLCSVMFIVWANSFYTTLTTLTSTNTRFHLLITTPHMVTSSPALQESTKSSSSITHMARGMVPTASFWTCSCILISW